jgi:L-lactate permease
MAGREGEVMRKMMVYTGTLLLLVSLMTALGIFLLHGG